MHQIMWNCFCTEKLGEDKKDTSGIHYGDLSLQVPENHSWIQIQLFMAHESSLILLNIHEGEVGARLSPFVCDDNNADGDDDHRCAYSFQKRDNLSPI